MFTHFRKAGLALVAIYFMTGLSALNAQRAMTVTVNTVLLNQPYNVPFLELQEKVMVTLLSNTSLEGVYLTMRLSGDNGVLIQSNGNQLLRFYIEAGVPLVLPTPDLDLNNLFLRGNLNFSNIDMVSPYSRGLPPGNYQLCFQVWRSTGVGADVIISSPLPAGCANFTIQQPSVNITTIVKPPWNADFLEYYDKTIVNLSSAQNAEVYLHMKLRGNNGIEIATVPGTTTSLIDITAGVPVMLTGQDLYELFIPDMLSFSGISYEELSGNGLPEGTYRLCFIAYSLDGAVVSAPDPSGCGTPFTLQLLDPPTIISPKCGESYGEGALKPLLFSWTPSPGAPPGVPYTLRIVEINDPNAPPGDALLTATTPAFFEETVLGTSFFYGPAQPMLEEGKKYAFQVITGTEALDVQNAFDFNSGKYRFKNKGKSEPCYFLYGSPEPEAIALVPLYKAPEPKVAEIPQNVNILPYTMVTGQLNYKFKPTMIELINTDDLGTSQGQGSSQTGGSTQTQAQGLSGNMVTYTGIGAANENSQSYSNFGASPAVTSQDVAQFLGYIDPVNSKPLASISISMVVRYIMHAGNINGKNASGKMINKGMFISEDVYKTHFPDDGKVLQTTQTASDGSFSFTFINTDTTFGKLQSLQIPHSAEISDGANGTVIKTVRLIVNSKYYCSPDVNFNIKPWQSNDFGTLVSYVKSYRLRLHVNSTTATFYDQGKGSGTPLNDVNVKVLRSGYIPGVPYNEGEITSRIPMMAGTKKKVSENNTNMDGVAIIHNLIMHDPDNNSDRYYISCMTSETSGNINYKDVEKRYSPLYLKDKKNFPFNSIGEELITPVSEPNVISIPYYEQYGLGITFNSEFEIQTFDYSIEMYPELPRVYGQAFVTGMKDLVNLENTMSDTIKPGVKVLLFSQYEKLERIPATENTFGTLSIKNTYTDGNGRYSFEKLPLEIDMSGWKAGDPVTYKGKVVGPKRWLLTKPNGFGAIEKDLGTPKYGDQIEANLMLNPDGIAMGYVVDEEGKAVPSSVKIEGYPAVKTGSPSLWTVFALAGAKAQGIGNIPQGSQMFVFLAPSAESSKLKIIPNDLSTYAPFDTSIRIAKVKDTKPGEVGKYVVKKLMHRVQFKIQGYSQPQSPGKFQLPAKPLKGVKVKVSNIVEKVEGISDENGMVTLQFAHSETSFKLDVIPPDDSDFPSIQKGFSSTPGIKIVFKKAISLYPGNKINGTVTIGEGNEPVDSAKIYIDGNPDIHTYSDKNGKYLLRKIPSEINNCIVKAEKYDPEKTIIGDNSGQIILPRSTSVNLHLEIVPGMPSELFGFPIVIDSVQQNGNTALISGSLADATKLKSGNFQLQSSEQVQLNFSKVKLVKSTTGSTFEPEASSILLDADKLDLIINNSYVGEHLPVSGALISIEKGNSEKGVIRGKVKLKNSFGFNANLFSFKDGGGWLNSGQPDNKVTVFSPPSPIALKPLEFGLSGSNGGDFGVSLKGFDGIGHKNNSFLSRDTMILSLSLSTNEIQNINPSKITIGIPKLRITNSGFEPVNGTQELKFDLENWKVTSKDWKFSQQSAGFELGTAILKTGTVDLPVGNIEITPGSFHIWQIKLKEMNLSGVAPVTLETEDVSFGYFNSIGKDQKGHWRLAAVGLFGKPAVTISGLPGLKPGTKLSFGTFAFLSNGEQSLDFIQSGEELEFYQTLKVKPIAIYPYNGYFLLDGSMDLGIPRIEKQNGSIRYSKTGGAIKFDLYPLNMDFEGPGKVRFYSSQLFGDQKFSNGTFQAPGEIRDEEGIKLKGVLHRTLTDAWLEVNPYNQILPIGSNGTTRLIDVRGEMRVDNQVKDWKLFKFDGIMDGVKGMEGDKKKSFTIYGDIVASNQNVKVKNIDTGFGQLNITFDYKNARMVGDMDINQSFGGITLHGVANMLVDGSGWYFLAGGQAEVPGLGGIQAGFMIGDYSIMPPDITGKLMQFAYDKHIPPSFSNHISGMFITGRKSVPIIDIPDINIDLWIMSARLGVDAGLDARLWMGFDGGGNEYGIGAMAFAHAYFVASSITCTNLSADARVEMGAKGNYNTGTGNFTVEGCGSFSLSARIEQCFPTLVAGCQGCIGKTLSESIKVNMLLNSQGKMDLSFGFGNCSGQSTMSTGW